MRLAPAAAAVLCLVLGAAPAYGQSGPPTTLGFDDLEPNTDQQSVYPDIVTIMSTLVPAIRPRSRN